MQIDHRCMCKAAEVGKIVVNKCLDAGFSINTQKLQKLLALMQVECIKRSNNPLFPQDIVVWDCSVAIEEVDKEFYSEAIGFTESQKPYILLLEAESESVEYVLSEYGEKSAFELNLLPNNQKIIELGTKNNNTNIPHISCEILMGAFS